MRDPRDLPFAVLTARILLTLPPLAVALYLLPVGSWYWLAVTLAYLVLNNVVFKGPFGLMLHCTSHRPLFKREYQWANRVVLPWVLSPLFGQAPETYFSHHIGMHHPENNLDEDMSSTIRFRRDSLRHFLLYFGRFLLVGIFDLRRYLLRKNRITLCRRAVLGELLFFLTMVGLSFVNFWATFVVLILPFLLFRIIAMLGNWTQHAFVCPEQPGNPYRNSITVINVKYNHKCWNDGYHASHHVRPTLHWTEHPKAFQANLDTYAREGAIVFDGMDFLGVFVNLMRRRYDVLARHVLNLGGTFRDQAEVEALLRYRTQAIRLPG